MPECLLLDSSMALLKDRTMMMWVAGGGEGMLCGFLDLVLRCLLLDSSMAGSLTGLAADALLPLILGHPTAYQHIGRES